MAVLTLPNFFLQHIGTFSSNLLLFTIKTPPGYPWASEGQFGTPEPNFRGPELDHQVFSPHVLNLTTWGIEKKEKAIKFKFLKIGLKYQHQISTKNLLRCPKEGIFCQKCLRFYMGMADPIFKPYPNNFKKLYIL